MNGEIWKPIPGFDGYEVSNKGRVRSLYKRRGTPGFSGGAQWEIVDRPQRILRPGSHPNGYRSFNLRKEGKSYQRKASNLVAFAFIGPRPDGMHVCHNNGNPQDDRVENLRYDTPRANMQDAIKHGTKNGINEAGVVEIRNLVAEGAHLEEIAARYSITCNYVRAICTGNARGDIAGPRTSFIAKKLSSKEVRRIRQERAAGRTLEQIAAKYQVDQSMVSLMVRGLRWPELGGPIQGRDYKMEWNRRGPSVPVPMTRAVLRLGEG